MPPLARHASVGGIAPDEAAPPGTAESILIDGANSVGSAPRQHFPRAALSAGIAVIALALAFVWMRRRARIVPVLLGLAALPGLYVVLAVRPDAPATRGAMAQVISSTLEDLERHAPWPARPVSVVREDDGALYPLARYAIPARPVVVPTGREVVLELRGARLGQPCVADPTVHHVVCGTTP